MWALGLVPAVRNYYCVFHQYLPIPESILKILLWFGLFHIIKIFWVFICELTKRGKDYSFESKNWQKEWIFNGQSYTHSNPDRIIIRSSRVGCLLKKYVWKNLGLACEMRFLKDAPMKHVGLIFRAKDLENYFMLEIFLKNGENKIYIKPHVRSQGAWEFIQETFVGNFDLLQFQKVELQVNNVRVRFYISGNKVFEWSLPTHVDINHIEAGVSGLSDETTSRGIIPRIDFRVKYGMIGFRAYPGQGAEIKNLHIKEKR